MFFVDLSSVESDHQVVREIGHQIGIPPNVYRLFKINLLESPIEVDLSMDEIMADLEPDWITPHADPEESEKESGDAAA